MKKLALSSPSTQFAPDVLRLVAAFADGSCSPRYAMLRKYHVSRFGLKTFNAVQRSPMWQTSHGVLPWFEQKSWKPLLLPKDRLKQPFEFWLVASVRAVLNARGRYGTPRTSSSGAFYLLSDLRRGLDLGTPPFDPPSGKRR
jgi:hypothetical protein